MRKPLEVADRKHARIELCKKDFLRLGGTNIGQNADLHWDTQFGFTSPVDTAWSLLGSWTTAVLREIGYICRLDSM